MTAQEAIDHIAYFTDYDLGVFYGASPTTAQKLFLLNWAQKLIGKDLKVYRPHNALTLAQSFTFNLRDTSVVERKVVEATSVIVNGVKLTRPDGQTYGFWTMPELERYFPTWMLDAADTPQRAVVQANVLYLHPKPTAAVVAAAQAYVPGTALPLDKVDDSGGPADAVKGLGTQLDLPDELHEACALLTAAKAALPQLSETDAWRRVGAYNMEWVEIARTIAMANGGDLVDFATGPLFEVYRG